MNIQLAPLIELNRKAYFVGIGGVGMSGLARVLKARGLSVKGSDSRRSKTALKLESEGITAEIGHPDHFEERPDFLVYSSAIHNSDPQLQAARSLGIPIFHRAEVLSFLMNQGISIAITGTHGKTTSSAMAAFLATEAGFCPTCLVGGDMLNYGSNVVVGNPNFFISEVDESDRSHLRYFPDVALITGLEPDHLDVYSGMPDLMDSFGRFTSGVEKTGTVVYSFDNPGIKEVMKSSSKSGVSFGLTPGADFYAQDTEFIEFGSRFHLFERRKSVDVVELRIPGLHNVANSLGVIAALRSFGIEYEQFLKFLPEFHGVRRRLEVKLNRPEWFVVDDYAHHPSEVRASLAAVAGHRKKITAVFQPHRYSRTRELAKDFSNAFDQADTVLLTEVYGAGEPRPEGVSSRLIYDSVRQAGHPDVQLISKSEVIPFLSRNAVEGAAIVFMGAGDIGEVADEFANQCEGACSHRR